MQVKTDDFGDIGWISCSISETCGNVIQKDIATKMSANLLVCLTTII